MADDTNVADFEPMYAAAEQTEGVIPYDIGGPQPVVEQLVAYGALRGEVRARDGDAAVRHVPGARPGRADRVDDDHGDDRDDRDDHHADGGLQEGPVPLLATLLPEALLTRLLASGVPPSLSLERLADSKTVVLRSLRGRPVLVYFWATW